MTGGEKDNDSGAGIYTAFVAGWATQVRHKAQMLLVTKAFTGSAEPSAVQVATKKPRACGAHWVRCRLAPLHMQLFGGL